MKILGVFLFAGFAFLFAAVPAWTQNCNSHVTPFDTVQSAIAELSRGQDCLNLAVMNLKRPETSDVENKIQTLQKRIEDFHVDWLQSTASFTENRAIDNEHKISELELRLSTVETKLRMAEETIQRLQLESSLQMPRHPARAAASKPKAAVSKPKANKPKIDDWQDVATPRSSKPKGLVKKPTPTVDPPKDD